MCILLNDILREDNVYYCRNFFSGSLLYILKKVENKYFSNSNLMVVEFPLDIIIDTLHEKNKNSPKISQWFIIDYFYRSISCSYPT
jgi:hypothetical protein